MNFLKLCQEVSEIETGIKWCTKNDLLPSKDAKNCAFCTKVETVVWRKKSRNINFPYSLMCKACGKDTSVVKKHFV